MDPTVLVVRPLAAEPGQHAFQLLAVQHPRGIPNSSDKLAMPLQRRHIPRGLEYCMLFWSPTFNQV